MLTFACPCGKQLQTSEANAGRATRCPQCGKTIMIPGPTEAIQAEVVPSPPPATAIKEPRRPRRTRDDEYDWDYDREYDDPRRQRAPEGASGKAVACLILGIASFCVPILPAIIGIVLGCVGLGDINRSRGRLAGRGLIIAGIVTALVGNVLAALSFVLLIPAVQRVREAAARTQSQNNLKQITLAMHSFNDTHRRLPPAVVYGKDGRPLYSWRVLILPFIEEDPLFRQFKLDEPWDSPNNLPLLERMPAAYRHPNQDPALGHNLTHYQVFNGPTRANIRERAAFVSSPTLPLVPFRLVNVQVPVFESSSSFSSIPRSFPDGTSNTIMVAEAAVGIPWSKPGDLDFDPEQPLPKLGGLFLTGFNVGMADGSVRFIDPSRVSEHTIRLAIMANDGQPLPMDWPPMK